MDSLTHTAIGICLGQMIAGKQLGRKAMLYGAIANNLPDADVIANFWASESQALLIHRGITHSILACTLLTPSLALLCRKIYRNSGVTTKQWLLMWGSGLFIHILIDALTSYGTGWFEPFSHVRVSFNTIFILDPLLTLPLLVSALVLLIAKDRGKRRNRWALAGLICGVSYLTFTIVNKIKVNDVVKNNLHDKNVLYSDYMATPTPLNNFLWYVVAKSGNNFELGYYSLLDRDENFSLEKFGRNDSLLNYNCEPEKVNELKQFSQGYYCANLVNDTVIFSDMRFGQIGGWHIKQAPFVFNFRLARNCSNRDALQKGRFENFSTETTLQLFKRILGNN